MKPGDLDALPMTPPTGPAALTDGSTPPAQSALPATIPLRRDVDTWSGDGHGPLQVVPMLVLLAVVIGGVAWRRMRTRHPDKPAPASSWRRWLTPAGLSDGLRIKQSLRLTPRASVHVLDWDGQELLVACTETAVTVLERRVSPGDAKDRAASPLTREDA
jgi:hypothetical protein